MLWEGDYLRMVRRGHWEYVERRNVTGIVVIVAVTDDDRIVLVEQHRPPVNAAVIELPAGLVGDEEGRQDESLRAAAERELLEETGYTASRWRRLYAGAPSAGLCDEVLTFFLAEGLTREHAGGGDESEDITVHTVPLATLRGFLAERQADGAVLDAKLFAPLYVAAAARRSAPAFPPAEPDRLLDGLLEATADAACIALPDGTLVALNETLAGQMGRPREDLLGTSIYSYWPPHVARRRRALHESVVRTGKPLVYEDEREGRRFHSRIFPLLGPDGDVVRLVGFIRDVTEQERDRETLEATLKRLEGLERIINRSPAIVSLWRVTDEFPVEYLSESVRQLGYEPGDFYSGQVRIADVTCPEDYARLRSEVQRCVAENLDEFSILCRMRSPGGRRPWYRGHCRLLRDDQGTPTHVETIALEVSELIETEQALRDSEEMIRAVMRSLHQTAVTVFDYDGRMLESWASEAIERKYGLPTSRLRGMKLADVYPPELAAKRLGHIRHVWETGEALRVEYPAVTLGGTYWLETTHTTLRDADGAVVGVVGFSRDITESKQDQQALKQARARLAGARDAERQRIARDLHDTVAQQLIALRLRMDGLAGSDAPEGRVREELHDLAGSLRSLAQEVRQISHELYPPTLEALGLYAALRQSARVWNAGDVAVEIVAHDGLDESRLPAAVEIALFRIAQEAVGNGIRHGRARRITVRLGREQDRLRMTVEDDGKGFDPDGAGAKGLGMTSMRERAEAIGGSLSIASEPGRTVVRIEVITPAANGR